MAENTIIHEISLAGYKATSPGGMLDEADIAEVETLAQEYYDALDAASENAETNEQIQNPLYEDENQ